MKPMHVLTLDDAIALQMENELLTYEVRHLRARLVPRERRMQRMRERLDNAREQRDEAIGDLRWVLHRLDHSPLGPAFRRVGGYRALRDKYLGDGQ